MRALFLVDIMTVDISCDLKHTGINSCAFELRAGASGERAGKDCVRTYRLSLEAHHIHIT